MSISTSSLDHKEVKRPDAIQQTLTGAVQSTRNHYKIAGSVIAGILIAVAAWSMVKQANDKKALKAQDAFYLANKAHDEELKKLATTLPPLEDKTPKADPKAKADKKDSNEEPKKPELDLLKASQLKTDANQTFAGAMAAYKKVATDFTGTRASFEAQMKLGDLYYDHGDSKASIEWYQNAVKSAPGSFEKTLAFYSLGYAFENSKQFDDAIKIFDQAVGLGEASLQGDLWLAKARNQELAGKKDQAQATYDLLISKYPNTDYAKKAESLKAGL